ncbi:transcriptional regulator [Opitutaceae bacterium TAV1]|nr:transcriptional regulator [Opitutaceae bacterium TAV1]
MLRPRPSNVSLSVIAQAAGVSVSTVSRALNDDPQIPDETRRRIVALARKLGYKKNASVTALMRSFRAGGGGGAHQEVLAFLVDQPQSRWTGLNLESHHRILSGIRARAENLGYQVDVFWTHEPGRSLPRLGSILRARGIRGVILGPLPEAATLAGFPWENFAAVALGYMLESPRLHRVQTDMYENMSVILAQFAARGYERVGFITNATVEQRLGQLAAACFAIRQQALPARKRIPVLTAASGGDPALDRWLEKYRPDTIVSQVEFSLAQVRRIPRRDGGEIGFAWLAAQLNAPGISGTVPRHEAIGAAALDLLASLVAHGDKGVPAEPRSILIPGEWREGTTVQAPAGSL